MRRCLGRRSPGCCMRCDVRRYEMPLLPFRSKAIVDARWPLMQPGSNSFSIQAGVPEDVFSMTTGNASTGSAVTALKGLGGVFFTGSHKTGLVVAQNAASNLVKVSLDVPRPSSKAYAEEACHTVSLWDATSSGSAGAGRKGPHLREERCAELGNLCSCYC